MRNRAAISNIPFNYNKNLGQQTQAIQSHLVQKKGASPHTGVCPKKQNTGRDTANPKMMSISSNNSNLTSFTNKTLHSVLSPNCNFSNPNYAGNISYSTLKSTNSNIKSISKKSTKQASIKTSNSRNTQKSSAHKFQMNNNFLNLLKKKNLEHAAAQNPNNNSQNNGNGQCTPEFLQKNNLLSNTYSQHHPPPNPNPPQNLFLNNSQKKTQKNTSLDTNNGGGHGVGHLGSLQEPHPNSNFLNIRNFINHPKTQEKLQTVNSKNRSTRKSINAHPQTQTQYPQNPTNYKSEMTAKIHLMATQNYHTKPKPKPNSINSIDNINNYLPAKKTKISSNQNLHSDQLIGANRGGGNFSSNGIKYSQ
jgi:hypothetical protein